MPQVMNTPNVGYTLRTNEIFSALSNMIISQQTHADNIKGVFSSLVEKSKVDGSLYGDTKLYYDTDVLETHAWGNDAEASNLLALDRPNDPSVQAIYIDVFRQVRLTVDEYLSKRAWGSEGAFSQFQSVMTSWIRDTKRIYEATTFNVYVGTARSSVQDAHVDAIAIGRIEGDASLNTEEKGRQEAKVVAQYLADLFVNLKDVSRDYNDYGYLRSYDDDDLMIVWNSAWVNKIRKVDLPTIFHEQGLIGKFAEDILPSRYFGNINSGTTVTVGTTRALYEMTIGNNHYFAGDLIKSGDVITANTTYNVDANIICKVIHKRSIPFMSAFEVGTSFYNPRSLTTNFYLTWGHNTIEYLLGKPFITITADMTQPSQGE